MAHRLYALLKRLVVSGKLTVIDADGAACALGDGTGPEIIVRIKDRATERALARDPHLALGEAYMTGQVTIEKGSLYDLLWLLAINLTRYRKSGWERSLDAFRMAMRRLDQYNPVNRSRRNVAHHYDIDGAIYDLFLDSDKQYSCGYFQPNDNLELAQLRKKRHLAAKLCLEPGQRVLDIGSGWGGLALYLASVADVEVTGVTLSEAQIAVARERLHKLRLDGRVQFNLQDYRLVDGRFDRVVSVGMFEHVGISHYGAFFDKIHGLLTDDGVALIHTIGRSDGAWFTNPFIAKYIFPGGYHPALSEILPAIENSGLVLTDVEVLRLHYAETLKAWRNNFEVRRATAVRLKGEEFARMWEFYLAGSEIAFRLQGLVVFQLQLSRRVETVPLTRDYIGAAERQLELREMAAARPTLRAGE